MYSIVRDAFLTTVAQVCKFEQSISELQRNVLNIQIRLGENLLEEKRHVQRNPDRATTPHYGGHLRVSYVMNGK